MRPGPTDLAVIDALWIGEKKPDIFSWLIQLFLSWTKRQRISYSHNAFIFYYTDTMWHATTPGGVTECSVRQGLKGSVVRAKKRIYLNVTNEFFHGWLQGERGKSYAHRQNVMMLIGSFIPFVKSRYRDGDRQRNCSEFLAAACQFSEYRIPRGKDYLLPTCTAEILKPHFFS